MLHGLLSSARAGSNAWLFPVSSVHTWSSMWPLDQPTKPDIFIQIKEDLSVDLSEWVLAAENGGILSVAALWLKALRTKHETSMCLTSILSVAATTKHMLPLLGQILWHASHRMEQAMAWALVHGRTRPHAILVKPVDLTSAMQDRHALDYQLLRHVISAREYFIQADTPFYCISLDKANVGGQTLPSAFWATADNKAIIACPQADWRNVDCDRDPFLIHRDAPLIFFF